MSTSIKCPTCLGHGHVASHNGESWSQFAGLPYGSEEMVDVREGRVTPLDCPTCKGRRVVAETIEHAKSP